MCRRVRRRQRSLFEVIVEPGDQDRIKRYPLGLTRGPILNSRPSWDSSTSATRRASAGRGRCIAHPRSARSTVQADSRETASSRVLTASGNPLSKMIVEAEKLRIPSEKPP
jgi:hypothetical protein